jgi:shikimate dehydrogenase
MKCGLLGRKLGHSYSPQIHSQFGSYSYDLFELEPEKLGEFLRNADFSGLNVTMPYKKSVIPILDTLSAQAQKLGAVNTIVKRDNKLIGHNTDYFGFCSMVQKSGLSPIGKKCLVLGSGGASNTACVALEELGAEVKVISRSGESRSSPPGHRCRKNALTFSWRSFRGLLP